MVPKTGGSSTVAPSDAKCVVVLLNIAGTPLGVVAVVRSFAKWKVWFKRNHVRPDDQIVRDDAAMLEIQPPLGAWRRLYHPSMVLLYPEDDCDVRGDEGKIERVSCPVPS